MRGYRGPAVGPAVMASMAVMSMMALLISAVQWLLGLYAVGLIVLGVGLAARAVFRRAYEPIHLTLGGQLAMSLPLPIDDDDEIDEANDDGFDDLEPAEDPEAEGDIEDEIDPPGPVGEPEDDVNAD
jgi:hypothetical protein